MLAFLLAGANFSSVSHRLLLPQEIFFVLNKLELAQLLVQQQFQICDFARFLAQTLCLRK
jgi:hypothetical protein